MTWAGTVSGMVSRTFNNNFRVASQSVNGAATVSFTDDDDNLLTGAGDLAVDKNGKKSSNLVHEEVTDSRERGPTGETEPARPAAPSAPSGEPPVEQVETHPWEDTH